MATAIAHPNIALIKYWGKSDEELIIPATSSISLTLEAFQTKTTVELCSDALSDVAEINGVQLFGVELERVVNFLDNIRQISGSRSFAKVTSTNTVPTAAGLASSASGFAALAVAAAKAYNLDLSRSELSRLARRGSGSACRSLFGGMAIWNAGSSDESSFAEQLEWQGQDLEMLIAVVSDEKKPISSRKAMVQTIASSPYYDAWVKSNNALVSDALEAISQGDLAKLGNLTELSTMRMHAAMLASDPPIRYLAPVSHALFDAAIELREQGLHIYATADAGPNVKFLCSAKHTEQAKTLLQNKFENIKILKSRIGGSPKLIEQ